MSIWKYLRSQEEKTEPSEEPTELSEEPRGADRAIRGANKAKSRQSHWRKQSELSKPSEEANKSIGEINATKGLYACIYTIGGGRLGCIENTTSRGRKHSYNKIHYRKWRIYINRQIHYWQIGVNYATRQGKHPRGHATCDCNDITISHHCDSKERGPITQADPMGVINPTV